MAAALNSSKPTLAELPSAPRDTSKPLNLVEAISDVALKKVCENGGEMAFRIGGREVYRSTSRLLGTQESRVHSFAIVHHPPVFSVDLKVGEAAPFEREAMTLSCICWDVVSTCQVTRAVKAAQITRTSLGFQETSEVTKSLHHEALRFHRLSIFLLPYLCRWW